MSDHYAPPPAPSRMERLVDEILTWMKTVASAAVYATLLVTFVFQVARVEGHSMASTLADQDRLIVNKFAYRMADPAVGDIVMLYSPMLPDKSLVKRVMAEEGDQVRIVDGKVYCRRNTSSAASTCAGGRSSTPGCSSPRNYEPVQTVRSSIILLPD